MILSWVSEVIKEPWPQSDLVERTELGKVNSTRLDEEFRSLVSLLLIFLLILRPFGSWPETITKTTTLRTSRCNSNIKRIPISCQILWHIVWQTSQVLMIYWPDALQEPGGFENVKIMLQCEMWQTKLRFLLIILPYFLTFKIVSSKHEDNGYIA